jgi:hypothetical protein
VAAVLATVARWAPGSDIVYSRVLPPEELAGEDLAESLASAIASARMDEPWLTVQSLAAWTTHLTTLGFTVVDPKAAFDKQWRLFVGRRDGLREPQFEQLVSAVTARLVEGTPA